MADGFIGEIRLYGFNFAPRNWAFCDGQIMSIASNTALFSLLGTTYGGNGQTTFALPDLRGRMPQHQGQGPGLPYRQLGEVGGTDTVTLTQAQMPAHTHALQASSGPGTHASPSGAVLAGLPERFAAPFTVGTPDVQMSPQAVSLTGGSQPFSVKPPYLTLSYCICLFGIFPSRN